MHAQSVKSIVQNNQESAVFISHAVNTKQSNSMKQKQEDKATQNTFSRAQTDSIKLLSDTGAGTNVGPDSLMKLGVMSNVRKSNATTEIIFQNNETERSSIEGTLTLVPGVDVQMHLFNEKQVRDPIISAKDFIDSGPNRKLVYTSTQMVGMEGSKILFDESRDKDDFWYHSIEVNQTDFENLAKAADKIHYVINTLHNMDMVEAPKILKFVINNVIKTFNMTLEERAIYLWRVFPVSRQRLIFAVERNFIQVAYITIEQLKKHLPASSVQVVRGNLAAQRTGDNSTKLSEQEIDELDFLMDDPDGEADGQWVHPPPSEVPEPTWWSRTTMVKARLLSKDQGQILLRDVGDLLGSTTAKVWTSVYEQLRQAGHKIRIQVLDNVMSPELRLAMAIAKVSIRLVPPKAHSPNS